MSTLASGFLWVGGCGFLLLFALPLLFAPLRWAKLFQWSLPENTDLTVYLGRCLGAVALVITFLALRAASNPAQHRYVFEIIGLVSGLMTLIHVWGAIRRVQPWTETVEIALYATMTILATVAFRGLS